MSQDFKGCLTEIRIPAAPLSLWTVFGLYRVDSIFYRKLYIQKAGIVFDACFFKNER